MYDSIGQLFMNLSIFGSGALFGILGLLFGIARGMTKNSDMWALIFSTFAWLIALIAPNATFAAIIFFAGTIGITLAFTPMIKEVNESNIFAMAIIIIVMNVLIGIGTQAYSVSANWNTEVDATNAFIINIFETVGIDIANDAPNTGMCLPNEESSGRCKTSVLVNTFNALTFDTVGTVLAIATYVGIAINLAAKTLLMPFLLSNIISASITNKFILFMMAVYIMLWQYIIIYNMIMFVLNKRGK